MSLAAEHGITLTQHVLRNQSEHPTATGQFSQLITQIGVASKVIAAQVRRAGIIEVWGSTGDTNVQGETVQKLDRIANDTFVEVLARSGCVAAMASEEETKIIEVPDSMRGDYVVAFDPLDGSSNIDANITIGTVFAIYQRRSQDGVSERDFLRPGREQVSAGYVIYGSSTALVYTDGESVNAFTLDPSCGEFFLTRENMKMTQKTKLLSLNECNEPYWPAGIREYVDSMKSMNTGDGRVVSSRHIGSLVADFHRNLIKGGVFLYPENKDTGRGKLRILYECNPLAFIAEVAGGAASNGKQRILDLAPTDLHQRTALYIGSKEEVAKVESFLNQGKTA